MQIIIGCGNSKLCDAINLSDYVEVREEHFNLPQKEVAKLFNMRPSTFSKRWGEATNKKHWPYRKLCKINNKIKLIAVNNNNKIIGASANAQLMALLEEKKVLSERVIIKIK